MEHVENTIVAAAAVESVARCYQVLEARFQTHTAYI